MMITCVLYSGNWLQLRDSEHVLCVKTDNTFVALKQKWSFSFHHFEIMKRKNCFLCRFFFFFFCFFASIHSVPNWIWDSRCLDLYVSARLAWIAWIFAIVSFCLIIIMRQCINHKNKSLNTRSLSHFTNGKKVAWNWMWERFRFVLYFLFTNRLQSKMAFSRPNSKW